MIRQRSRKSQSSRQIFVRSQAELLAAVLIALCASVAIGDPALAQGRPPQGGPPGGPPPGGAPPGGAMRPQMPRPPKPLKVQDILDLAEQQHRAADGNRDSYLTKDEIRSKIGQMADAAISSRFGTIDTDRNGTIDKAEFTAWQKSMGSLVLSDTAAASVNGAIVPETIPFETDPGMKGELLRMLVDPLGVTVIVNSDQNYDGLVDVTELQRHQRRRFDALDKNADGLLTFDEMPRPDRPVPGGMPPMPMRPDDAPEPDRVSPEVNISGLK
jgi:hypothetical protein